MIYSFDTSAINKLLDDAESEPIVQTLLSVGSFRITAFNVIEAAKTPCKTRRRALVDLIKRLAAGKRPLDLPNTILRSYAKAHAESFNIASVNTDADLEGLWIALNDSNLIDEEARKEVAEWAAKTEQDFAKVVAVDRDVFQAFFKNLPCELPLSVASTLREYLNRTTECRSLIGEIYIRQTGRVLDDSGYGNLVSEPVWPLYFVGYAYAIHKRAIQINRFQERRNASAIDLAQAIYLTMCNRFITNDREQYKAMRMLNVLNTKCETEVMLYSQFRNRLMVF